MIENKKEVQTFLQRKMLLYWFNYTKNHIKRDIITNLQYQYK